MLPVGGTSARYRQARLQMAYTESELGIMATTLTEIGTLIERNPDLHGGRPVIAGAGVSVRAIAIDSNNGLSPEEIVADRDNLSLMQVYAALTYYHANKAGIDADIAAESLAFDSGAAY